MIVSHLLLILHRKIQFYIFMFEAWNVANGRKVQGGRILSQGTVTRQQKIRSLRGEHVDMGTCPFYANKNRAHRSPHRTLHCHLAAWFCTVYTGNGTWKTSPQHTHNMTDGQVYPEPQDSPVHVRTVLQKVWIHQITPCIAEPTIRPSHWPRWSTH
jgi:hypothetical protein